MFVGMIKSLLVALGVASFVAAHGYVQEETVGGVKYHGYEPYSDPYYSVPPARIIRKIPSNGPVEDVSLVDIQCGGYTAGGKVGSAPAPLVATVAPGGTVTFNWTAWPDSHKGPIINYMARAPSDITKWMPGNAAVWFKVDQSGKDSSGVWATTKMTNNNSLYSFQIPSGLKPGQYIIRHEIVALHSAYNYPGAQFYPSCSQVSVTGTGTRFPTSFVSFPGAYTGTTPGIKYDIYAGGNPAYPIPGPAVWT